MSPLSTEYAMLLSAVYDTALPPVKLYEPRMRKNSAKTRVSTAESYSLFGGGQGIGQLAQDFKRPQRDGLQDDTAPDLTPRRQYSLAVFECRSREL